MRQLTVKLPTKTCTATLLRCNHGATHSVCNFMQKSDGYSLDLNIKQALFPWALFLKVYNLIFWGKEPVNSETVQIVIFAPQRSLEKQLKRKMKGVMRQRGTQNISIAILEKQKAKHATCELVEQSQWKTKNWNSIRVKGLSSTQSQKPFWVKDLKKKKWLPDNLYKLVSVNIKTHSQLSFHLANVCDFKLVCIFIYQVIIRSFDEPPLQKKKIHTCSELKPETHNHWLKQPRPTEPLCLIQTPLYIHITKSTPSELCPHVWVEEESPRHKNNFFSVLLSLRLKHAATWQRCHSNKAAAVVTEPEQRGNTYMFLF